MKANRIIYIFALLSLLRLNAQAPFKQSYDVVGDAFTKAYHTNTLDGGMILLTRSTNTFVTPTKWFTIFKTFPNGDLQWSQRFVQPGNCNISNIVQLPDSGYFFCFVELNFPEKYYITKLDKNGILVYCTSLTPPPNYIIAFDPQCISKGDGNVYVASDLHNLTNGVFGWHLFEVDGAGDIVFSNCYNGGILKCLERGFSLCTNGDVIMTGYQRDSIAMHYGPVITRIDSGGTLLWSKLYLDTTRDIAGISVFEMANGNIVATAMHTTPGNETIRLETDPSGNLLRSREYGSPANFLSPFTTLAVENNNTLIFGTTQAGSYSLKLDSVGDVLYAQRYYSIVPNRVNTYYGGYSFSGIDYSTNHAVIFTSDSSLVSCSGDTLVVDTGSISFQTIAIPNSYGVQLFDTIFPLLDTLWSGSNTKDCETIGIGEVISENSVIVYPIPASDFLRIECSFVPDNIMICDVSGRIVATTQPSEVISQIDITALAAGCYIILTFHETHVESRRLIIE